MFIYHKSEGKTQIQFTIQWIYPIMLPTAWQQPLCVHKISCHMASMFVATDTVDHEISCLPVHTVPGTTMAAFVIHFETQLPRSRVQSQLSNPEINQQKTSCTNGNSISGQCMTNNYKNAGSNRTATPGCGCGHGEPHRHHWHRGGDEPAQCHPKRQTRDSAADGNAGAPRLRRNHYESRAEKSTAEGRG